MAEPDSCDAAIRPFPDKHIELKCEVLTGTHTQHKHELKDYAYPGSSTVVTWFESDRRNYHGEYPGQCGTVIGCQLPVGHSGKHET